MKRWRAETKEALEKHGRALDVLLRKAKEVGEGARKQARELNGHKKQGAVSEVGAAGRKERRDQ